MSDTLKRRVTTFDYNIECSIYLISRYAWFIYLEDDDFRKYRGHITMATYPIAKKTGLIIVNSKFWFYFGYNRELIAQKTIQRYRFVYYWMDRYTLNSTINYIVILTQLQETRQHTWLSSVKNRKAIIFPLGSYQKSLCYW